VFTVTVFTVTDLQVHIIIILLIMLNQNQFLLQLLFSDDGGGAITCQSEEISQ